MRLPFFRKSGFRRIYQTERNVRCTVTKIPLAKTWFAYFPVLMQTFLLDSLNSVQKNALIRRNDPFFLLLRQLFSVLTVNSFFAVFFAKFGSTIWGCFLNVTNLGHLESLTLLVLNFLKVLSIFYHLQKFNVYIYSCNKITNTWIQISRFYSNSL